MLKEDTVGFGSVARILEPAHTFILGNIDQEKFLVKFLVSQQHLFKTDNGNVHRAAANIIVSKSRAARGSVCNVLLSATLPFADPIPH